MTLRLFALGTALTAFLYAADASGTWKAEVPMRDGPVPVTFHLKVEGSSLTGMIYSDEGEVALRDGKVSGDEISFVIDHEVRYEGKGKVEERQIRFSISRPGGGEPMVFIAKRAE
jgi:hypothetical protein